MSTERPSAPRMTAEQKRYVDYSSNRAAEKAVKKTLLTLGLDVSTDASIIEVQQDFSFVRKLRTLSADKRAQYLLAAFGGIMGIIGAVVSTFLIQAFHGGKAP